jgi:hypothetical protein
MAALHRFNLQVYKSRNVTFECEPGHTGNRKGSFRDARHKERANHGALGEKCIFRSPTKRTLDRRFPVGNRFKGTVRGNTICVNSRRDSLRRPPASCLPRLYDLPTRQQRKVETGNMRSPSCKSNAYFFADLGWGNDVASLLDLVGQGSCDRMASQSRSRGYRAS